MGKPSRRNRQKQNTNDNKDQKKQRANNKATALQGKPQTRAAGARGGAIALSLVWSEEDARAFPSIKEMYDRRGQFGGYLDQLRPADMDRLGMDITAALQRCSVPESTVTQREQQLNAFMMAAISTVDDHFLKKRKQQNQQLQQQQQQQNEGAMLRLLRNSIITPQNIKALLSMMDAALRTGPVRCGALRSLYELRMMKEVWKVKFPGDRASFALQYTVALCKFLHDESRGVVRGHKIAHLKNCPCAEASVDSLLLALPMAKDDPRTVCLNIASFDWTAILQSKNGPQRGVGGQQQLLRQRDEEEDDAALEDMVYLFLELHYLCVRALHKDPDQPDARKLLHKLGSCNELHARVLQRLMDRECWEVSDEEAESAAGYVIQANDFLTRYYTCLVSHAADDAHTNELVKKAHRSLWSIASSILCENNHVFLSAESLDQLERIAWDERKTLAGLWMTLCSQSRPFKKKDLLWRTFCAVHPVRDQRAKLKQKYGLVRKQLRKKQLALLEEQVGESGEMCANCFVLEKDLGQGELLLVCSRCNQIKYCSAECQRKHWKRCHKEQCQKCW